MTTALEAGEGSASRPGRSLPSGKEPVPIVQEAGWAPGPVWTGAENLAPSGIRSRTVQLVASRSTDYATRPTRQHKHRLHTAHRLIKIPHLKSRTFQRDISVSLFKQKG
jgi:hypothetical protein